jgi:tetratricopeptide (TPR) repeat protein
LLANRCAKNGAYTEGLDLIKRALEQNPLDRNLRNEASTLHLLLARCLTESRRFDDARAEYQTAIAYADKNGVPLGKIKWAGCEFKAGNSARAEELLAEAQAESGSRLGVAYALLVETIRLKLPQNLKNRFNKEFNAGLAEMPDEVAAVSMAELASSLKRADLSYVGQKTHEKKVLGYLEKALRADISEHGLQRLCYALFGMEAFPMLRKYAALGQRRFKTNPHFYFLEAESYFALGPMQCPVWKVQPLLTRARDLAKTLPPDAIQKELLELLGAREATLGMGRLLADPEALLDMFGGFTDAMYDDDEEFEDEAEFLEDW